MNIIHANELGARCDSFQRFQFAIQVSFLICRPECPLNLIPRNFQWADGILIKQEWGRIRLILIRKFPISIFTNKFCLVSACPHMFSCLCITRAISPAASLCLRSLRVAQSVLYGTTQRNPIMVLQNLVQEAVTANFRRDEAQPQHFLAHQPLCCAGLGFCTDGYLFR